MTDTHGTHANEAARDVIPNARDLAPEGREASSGRADHEAGGDHRHAPEAVHRPARR